MSISSAGDQPNSDGPATAFLSPKSVRELSDAWGDVRVAALADVVLSLAAEVFEIRMCLQQQDSSAEQQTMDMLADEFVSRIFAALLENRERESA